MPAPLTLSDVLQQSDARLRIFDMGKRISKLSKATFSKFEQGLFAYPEPYLHHAWLGLLLWHPETPERNAVWFLKFPLDEQGLLIAAVRDDFLNRLLKNIHQAATPGAEITDNLKDNPFAFTPDSEKMAMFHSLAGQQTGAAPSRYYPRARDYFTGRDGHYEAWDTVGFQGIADLCVQLDQPALASALTPAIAQLPNTPLIALCHCLEHIQPDHRIISAVQQRLERCLQQPDAEQVSLAAALLRGLSNGASEQIKKAAVSAVLASSVATHAEVLSAIASRCQSSLQYPDILSTYLDTLARGSAGQPGFSRILADLMFMPVMRALILHILRQPDRSPALSEAIGQMFGQSFQGS